MDLSIIKTEDLQGIYRKGLASVEELKIERDRLAADEVIHLQCDTPDEMKTFYLRRAFVAEELIDTDVDYPMDWEVREQLHIEAHVFYGLS